MTEQAQSSPLLRPYSMRESSINSTAHRGVTESSYLLPSSLSLSSEPVALYILDAVWSLNVIFPLLVVYWSGTWYLLDVYVTPTDYQLSAMICLVAGAAIILGVFHLMPFFSRHIPIRWSIRHVVVSRTIIYVSALGVLVYFRGVWNLVNPLLQENVAATVVVTALCQLILVLLRAAGNAAGSPLIMGLDTAEDFYKAPPRFRTPVCFFVYILISRI